MLWEISNLNNNQIGLIGHGGMGIYGRDPISSQPSLQRAIDMGADAVEMDVQMSRDSVLFVFHHVELQSSTGCSGKIPEMNSVEISCVYNGPFNKNLKVLRLDEMLNKLSAAEDRFFVFDCKTPDGASAGLVNGFVNALLKLIEKHHLKQRCFIESTNILFLHTFKNKVPQTKLFVYTQNFEQALQIAKDEGLFGITMDMNRITGRQVAAAHQAGFRVSLFNQKSEKDNLEAIEMSPDYLQTDKLKHILKIFEKYQR